MQTKFQSLLEFETWTLNTLPPQRQTIGCKWVFKLKENPLGTINKHKALLVANGFYQQDELYFHETFSPLVKPNTIRVTLIMDVTYMWVIQQTDINNVFLNEDL